MLTPTRPSPTIDGLAHVADLDEIAGNGFNLNIPLYVAPADDGEQARRSPRRSRTSKPRTATAAETRAALEAELAKWGLSA